MPTEHSEPTLELLIRYQDQKPVSITLTEADCPYVIGRNQLESLLNLDPKTLKSVSRKHLRVEFREHASHSIFWIVDDSYNGTIVEVPDGQAQPRRYRQESFSVPGKIHIRLQSKNKQSGNKERDDDVLIEVTNSECDDTEPTVPIVPTVGSLTDWESLLRNLTTMRTTHLMGMPGIGKSWLASRLGSPNKMWQRERQQKLGDVLVVWVDGHEVPGNEVEVWRDLGCQMLQGLRQALRHYGRTDIVPQINSALKYLKGEWVDTIREVSMPLMDALRPVIKEANLRPIFIFDNFDQVYAKVEPQMLYKLYQIHQRGEMAGRISFVIITQKSFANLRQDIDAFQVRQVRQFNQLMPQPILLDCFQRNEFNLVVNHLAPDTRLVGTQATDILYNFSGGHPGLAKELWDWLSTNDYLNSPDMWHEQLDALDVVRELSKSSRNIWDYLTDEQRRGLADHANGQPVSDAIGDPLRQLSIIRPDGEFFSPIFQECVPAFDEQERIKNLGLKIDLAADRVLLDGQDVTEKINGTRKDVLFYMYERRGELCTYKELFTNCWPGPGEYDQSCKETVQKTVTRLRQVVDPNREYILNEARSGYRLQMDGPKSNTDKTPAVDESDTGIVFTRVSKE